METSGRRDAKALKGAARTRHRASKAIKEQQRASASARGGDFERPDNYAGHPLLAAARELLCEDKDPRVAAAITVDGEEVRIDWAALEQLMCSHGERARLQMAQSLLDGTPIDLSALLVRALADDGPQLPQGIDER